MLLEHVSMFLWLRISDTMSYMYKLSNYRALTTPNDEKITIYEIKYARFIKCKINKEIILIMF